MISNGPRKGCTMSDLSSSDDKPGKTAYGQIRILKRRDRSILPVTTKRSGKVRIYHQLSVQAPAGEAYLPCPRVKRAYTKPGVLARSPTDTISLPRKQNTPTAIKTDYQLTPPVEGLVQLTEELGQHRPDTQNHEIIGKSDESQSWEHHYCSYVVRSRLYCSLRRKSAPIASQSAPRLSASPFL